MEFINVDFIIDSKKYQGVQYKIMSLIPARIREVKNIDGVLHCDYIDSYRVRYKLIVRGQISQISETKSITAFVEMEEILAKAGLKESEKYNVKEVEITYID